VSERGQDSAVVQGRSLYSPQTRRGGPVLVAPTPHHSGTDDSEGGPLWLQIQSYGLHVMLRQDHQLVSTTGALVTTRTGFPLQVSSYGMPMDYEDRRGQHVLPQWRPYRCDEICLSVF
jgi:hypothetical protein